MTLGMAEERVGEGEGAVPGAPYKRDEMSVKACHRLSMQDWGRGDLGRIGRGAERTGRETGRNWTAPTRKSRDEKDKDDMESARKERSFPGRLESIF